MFHKITALLQPGIYQKLFLLFRKNLKISGILVIMDIYILSRS